MGKTVVLAGALDTKGAEFSYVRKVIRRAGLDVLTVDFGVLGEPAFIPDISRAEVAQAGGGDLERWRSGEHKDEAMAGMAAALAVVVRRLFDEGRLDGIFSMGGSGGTSVATTAMRTLPVGCRSWWPRPWAAAMSAGTPGPRTSRSCLRSWTSRGSTG